MHDRQCHRAIAVNTLHNAGCLPLNQVLGEDRADHFRLCLRSVYACRPFTQPRFLAPGLGDDVSSGSSSSAMLSRAAPSVTDLPASLARNLASTSSAIRGLALRKSRAFSRPWPILSVLYEYQAPNFSIMLCSAAISTSSPSLEMPEP